MTIRKMFLGALTVALVWACNLSAGPIVYGELTAIPAPPSLALGAMESNHTAYLVQEASRLLVTPEMAAMWGVAAGSRVSLWLIHSDARGTAAFNRGSVAFDRPVLHLDTDRTALDLGDGLTGSGLLYPAGNLARGVESHDSIHVTGNRVSFDFRTFNQVDEARVVVEDTPEPATLGLVGIGLVGVVAASRRRARRG